MWHPGPFVAGGNYGRLFTNTDFALSLTNTVWFAGITVPGGLVLAVLFATSPGKPVRSLFSGTNLAVMKSTPEKQQAAWDFIKWLTQTKQSAYWTVQTTYLPVRKSALNEQILKDYIAKTPRFQVVLDLIPSGAPGISVAGWADARTYLLDAVTAADSLTTDPKQALDEAAAKSDQALNR